MSTMRRATSCPGEHDLRVLWVSCTTGFIVRCERCLQCRNCPHRVVEECGPHDYFLPPGTGELAIHRADA